MSVCGFLTYACRWVFLGRLCLCGTPLAPQGVDHRPAGLADLRAGEMQDLWPQDLLSQNLHFMVLVHIGV